MSLTAYNKKRDFKKTHEPKGKRNRASNSTFVVQKHHASHLHYDFRLEMGGVLKSWAVPKGPSLDPKQKRLAIQVEDHPVGYGSFEGEIPEGEYGGGHVIVWDTGRWQNKGARALADLKNGRIEFELFGEKLRGLWVLVRTRGEASRQWLLIKRTDDEARSGKAADVTVLKPASVVSALTIEEMEQAAPKAVTAVKASKRGKVAILTPAKEVSKIKLNRARPASPNSKVLPTSKSKIQFIEPQLARLHDSPPTGNEWVHEIKFDGYRTLARISGGTVTLYTRSGLDWTEKYLELAREFHKLKTADALLDGETVAVDENGRSDFRSLQETLKAGKSERLLFYAFDLLALDGCDLREFPLLERKQKLQHLVEGTKKNRSAKIIFSQHWETNGQQLLKQSCRLDMEGIISKRIDAPYTSGRSDLWVKSKCGHNEEFVIAGFTQPKGSRSGFGALLLGAFDHLNELQYVGRVGTGFDDRRLKELFTKLRKLIVKKSPFNHAVPGAKSVTWVQPKLVAQIKFAEFTGDHIIRHASFVEMREDKAPGDVKIANAKTVKSAKNAKTSLDQVSKGVGGVLISHPERSIFEIGQDPITKFELAEYYELVSNRMVDFIRDRPLSLLRCPDGTGEECFFQKHLVSGKKSAIRQFKKALKERSEKEVSGVCIDSTQGLIDLVQMGIVEIHNWGCHLNQIERPDSVVFDLDPDPSVKWPQVIEAANLIRETLLQLKLVPFLKVTGGKGLHIHVPIKKKYTWNEAKLFTKTVAAKVSRREPKLYTTELMKKKRAGKIFIDYLRNGYGATAVAPYSVRARANAPVALPIEWSALTRNLEPAGFHLRDIARYLKDQKRDPWGGYSEAARRVPILEELSRVARKKR